jgi:hypothetical protein
MNSAAMREDHPDDDAGDRGQQQINPPNGLIASWPTRKMPEMPNSAISAITSQ